MRALGVGFLGLVGAAAALSAQAVGALLLLGLLAAPAGAAQRFTARPYLGSRSFRRPLGGGDVGGPYLELQHARVPPSFAILAVASAVYFGVLVASRRRRGVA